MANYPKWAKLSPEEFQRRIKSLESVYTQKELASKLGVSVRSLNYYQKGESFPKSKSKYQAINALYNREKKSIQPEKVEKRIAKQQKQSEAQRLGRIKWRTAPIYPDYMYKSPASYFDGVNRWEFLEELAEKGYVAGWRGREEIPLEVQFVIQGEAGNRFGRVAKVVVVKTRKISPKQDNGYSGLDTTITTYSISTLVARIKKTDSFEEKMDKLRAFIEQTRVDGGYIEAVLGFYFEEGDEK